MPISKIILILVFIRFSPPCLPSTVPPVTDITSTTNSTDFTSTTISTDFTSTTDSTDSFTQTSLPAYDSSTAQQISATESTLHIGSLPQQTLMTTLSTGVNHMTYTYFADVNSSTLSTDNNYTTEATLIDGNTSTTVKVDDNETTETIFHDTNSSTTTDISSANVSTVFPFSSVTDFDNDTFNNESSSTSELTSEATGSTTSTGTTTTRTTTTGTTTTANPAYCRGILPPVGIHSSLSFLGRGVIGYMCNPGYRETGNGSSVLECRPNLGWRDRTKSEHSPLVCEPIPQPQPHLENTDALLFSRSQLERHFTVSVSSSRITIIAISGNFSVPGIVHVISISCHHTSRGEVYLHTYTLLPTFTTVGCSSSQTVTRIQITQGKKVEKTAYLSRPDFFATSNSSDGTIDFSTAAYEVPDWLVDLLMIVMIVLLVCLICLLLLTVYVCCFRRVQNRRVGPSTLTGTGQDQTSGTSSKSHFIQQARPSHFPPIYGHLGGDGVAWILDMDDNALY